MCKQLNEIALIYVGVRSPGKTFEEIIMKISIKELEELTCRAVKKYGYNDKKFRSSLMLLL